jgi:NitT/TauT family transport system substrate-binding protein
MIARRAALLGAAFALASAGLPRPARATGLSLRVAALRFGSLSWLIDTIRSEHLDAKWGLELDVIDVATNQAGAIALMAGATDIIVSDWLWALRQRSQGADLKFAPLSAALGALMVRPGSGVGNLADLAGKRLGVAGSAIDKSWLLLRAYSRRTVGRDIAETATVVFGAAPLITEEIRQGRLDAVLNYWTFAARLASEGFTRLLDMSEVLGELGVEPMPPLVGFVWRERMAAAKRPAFEAFFAAVAAGNAILAESDLAWERLRPLVKPSSDAEFAAIRSFYRAGITGPWGAGQTRAAEKLVNLLIQLGDEDLLGSRTRFDPGLFHVSS